MEIITTNSHYVDTLQRLKHTCNIYVYIYIYVFVYIYVYIYINICSICSVRWDDAG